jgi:hypothetical protein
MCSFEHLANNLGEQGDLGVRYRPAPPLPGENGACCTSADPASRSGTLSPESASKKYPFDTESPIMSTFFFVAERAIGAPEAQIVVAPCLDFESWENRLVSGILS